MNWSSALPLSGLLLMLALPGCSTSKPVTILKSELIRPALPGPELMTPVPLSLPPIPIDLPEGPARER